MMAKVKVSAVYDPKTGKLVLDISAPDQGSCDRARKLIEGTLQLMGIGLDEVHEDDPGPPRQVETTGLPQRDRVRN